MSEETESTPPEHADSGRSRSTRGEARREVEIVEIELERAMLTIVLVDRERMRIAREEGGSAESFSTPSLGVLWATLEDLDAKLDPGEPFDIAVVADHVASDPLRSQSLNAIGGIGGIGELYTANRSPQGARQVAKRLAEKGSMRLIGRILRDSLLEYEAGGGADALGILSRMQEQMDRASMRGTDRPVSLHVANLMAIHELSQGSLEEFGPITTGLPELDDVLDGGFWRKQLVLVGGRPGMGKTSLGMYLMRASAESGAPALFVNYEMSYLDLAMRFISGATGVPMKRLRRRDFSPADAERLDEYARHLVDTDQLPLTLLTPDDTTIATLEALVRDAVHRNGVRLVGVDYVQLLTAPGAGGHTESRYAEVTEISRRLKKLAHAMDITVIAMAQLSRKADERSDKRPQLTDLKDSGQLEQDADVVVLLHRPFEFDESADPTEIDIHVAKQRQGRTDRVTVRWVPERATLATATQSAPPPAVELPRGLYPDDEQLVMDARLDDGFDGGDEF
jgi:replicative DNA helicase